MSRLRRAFAAIEERTGLGAAIRSLLAEPIPGGARWWYALGAVLTFLLALELVTGSLLAFFYSPSAGAAWASTAFIQDRLAAGWFIRGLHSFGATTLLIVAGLHFLQVLIAGAYKAPRELNWLVGLALLGLTVVFCLTGYGLPLDQKGYWAKVVETTILGAMPLVGPALETVAQGGDNYGNYAVTHLFAVHALLLPAATVALVVVHVALVRRHQVTPPAALSPAEQIRRQEPYWPAQAFRDVALSALAVGILTAFVLVYHGAALEGPADPTSGYQARPEWYMRPLYQLRMFLAGPLDILATLVIPGLAVAFLVALPFLDRGPARFLRTRWPLLTVVLGGASAWMALGLYSFQKDAKDPGYQRHRAEVAHDAALARSLAGKGVLPEGGTAVYRNDPSFAARELFNERCADCHTLTRQGGGEGPDLGDYNSRAWLEAFLRDPQSPLYMGGAKKPAKGGMRPVEASPGQMAALVELIYAQSGASDVDQALVETGTALFSEKNCDGCHEIEPGRDSDAPNLFQRGQLAYVMKTIENASRPELYGERSKMPRFANKLNAAQIEMLAKLVLSRGQR